jgi:hypothetical protein
MKTQIIGDQQSKVQVRSFISAILRFNMKSNEVVF